MVRDLQLSKIWLMSLTLLVFHIDISGIFFSERQLLKIPCILVIFDIFHFEISGKNSSDSHPENILFISIILSVFHFEISGKILKMNIHKTYNLNHEHYLCPI